MACPYFDPIAPRNAADALAAMLPLGDRWTGSCRAVTGEPYTPDESALASVCSLGYARGACPRFPPGEGPDAVRFAVSTHDESAVRVLYVLERDHHPFAHGSLEYAVPAGPFRSLPPGDDTFASQAHAYVKSYLNRKLAAGRS